MNGERSARIVPAVGVGANSLTSRARRLTARCALATLALLALSASAGAATRTVTPLTLAPAVTRGSVYLSLGDSVTFGYQEPTVVPAPNYHDASSFLGYPNSSALLST
jgi:hypothetical protein